MANIKVLLPQFGMGMQEAEIVRWIKAVGDPVEAGEPLRLRVLIDRSVVEVFANDRQAITRRIYPDAASNGVAAFAAGEGGRLTSLEIWDMMPSNPY